MASFNVLLYVFVSELQLVFYIYEKTDVNIIYLYFSYRTYSGDSWSTFRRVELLLNLNF